MSLLHTKESKGHEQVDTRVQRETSKYSLEKPPLTDIYHTLLFFY